MANVTKNRWFDPRVKRNLRTWKRLIQQTATPEGYRQLSIKSGQNMDTVNPFATNSLLDVEGDTFYICVIDCLPDTWSFTGINAENGEEIIRNGQSDGLWIFKKKALTASEFFWGPYAEGNPEKPMTIKGLAVYSIDDWNVLKPSVESNKFPYVIAYNTMPISAN